MTPTTQARELASCPFCGGEANPEEASLASVGASFTVTIYCDECHASSGTEFSHEAAAAAWNRRTDRSAQILAMMRENTDPTCGEYVRALADRIEAEIGG